jgi:hypothetical protein
MERGERGVSMERSMESAVVARDRVFVEKTLSLSKPIQKRLIAGMGGPGVEGLLEMLLEMYELRELRGEVLQMMKSLLLWKHEEFVLWGVEDQKAVEAKRRMELLKRVLVSLSKGKVGSEKLAELKGKLVFLESMQRGLEGVSETYEE